MIKESADRCDLAHEAFPASLVASWLAMCGAHVGGFYDVANEVLGCGIYSSQGSNHGNLHKPRNVIPLCGLWTLVGWP